MERLLRTVTKLVVGSALSISAIFLIIFWYKSRNYSKSKIECIWRSDKFLFYYHNFLYCQERKNNYEKSLNQLEKKKIKGVEEKTALKKKIEGMKAMMRIIAINYNEMSKHADRQALKGNNLPKKLKVVQ